MLLFKGSGLSVELREGILETFPYYERPWDRKERISMKRPERQKSAALYEQRTFCYACKNRFGRIRAMSHIREIGWPADGSGPNRIICCPAHR